MDAIKILGGLLGGRGRGNSRGGGGLGRQILEQVLHQQQQGDQQRRIAEQQRARQQRAQEQQIEAQRRAQQQRAQQQRAQQQRSQQQRWQGGQQLDGVLRDVYGRHVRRSPAHQQPQHRHDHHGHNHGYNDQQLTERAVVLIRAMINAAKADGSIDQCEQDEIVKRLEPLSPQETQFLRDEFRRPLNVHDFAHDVPRGMEHEVYSVSLMAIDLDTHHEANYLRELAECLRIDPHQCNDIHQHYGSPVLYR